jgi:multicomponent Na+:H+ antiporter subunit E
MNTGHPGGHYRTVVRTVRQVLFRYLLFGLIWWAMSEGELHHPGAAGLIVALAATVSLFMVPPGAWRIRVSALPRFLPYFLRQSVLGGIDVAGRALNPGLPLSPGLVEYRLSLHRPTSRVFFVWVVSLLPGTASVSLVGDIVQVHFLDSGQPQMERLLVIEGHVKGLFGTD